MEVTVTRKKIRDWALWPFLHVRRPATSEDEEFRDQMIIDTSSYVLWKLVESKRGLLGCYGIWPF